MAANFSVLLIENNLAVTASIVEAMGQHLESFRLSVDRNIAEAVEENDPANVVLLDLRQLTPAPAQDLSLLQKTCAAAPIFLLAEAEVAASELLRQAMLAGATDFFTLSPAGLLGLGRRLAQLHQQLNNSLPPATSLEYAFNPNDTPLAVQIIGPNNRIKFWNRAAAAIFKLNETQVLQRRVDELPLNPVDLARLKDIIDQARTTNAPFFVPHYPFEEQPFDSIMQAHVYPLHSGSGPADVCIVTAQVPPPPESAEDLYLKQELQMLLEASQEISGQLALKPTLEKAIEQVKLLLYADNCQIYFLERDNQTLRPALAVGPLAMQIYGNPISLKNEAINKILTRGKVALINGLEVGLGVAYAVDEQLLCAPLTAIKGIIIGLMIISRRRVPFEADELRFYASLVQQASSAINNARLFEETQRNLIELEILYSASTAISTQWNDQDVLNTLIEQIVFSMSVSQGFIASWDKTQNKGRVQAVGKTVTTPGILLNTEIEVRRRAVLQNMLSQQRPLFSHLNTPKLDDAERAEMEKYGVQSRLMVPLVAKGETIGWLELWDFNPDRIFTADEVRLSRTLAAQIAVALQNTNYLKQTQQTLDETTALYRITSALTSLQDPQAIMSTVLQEYLQAMRLAQGSVILFDFAKRQGVVKVHQHDSAPIRNHSATGGERYKVLEGQQIPLSGNPVYERLMRTRKSVTLDNPAIGWPTTATAALRQRPAPYGGWGDEEAFAILVTPIIIREEIVGVLVAENTRTNQPFSPWLISLGRAMADQLAIGLQNMQLYESEYRRREQAETLREVSSIVNSSLNLGEVLERILDQLGRVVKYDSAAIHLIDGKVRRVIAGRGFQHPEKHIGLTFSAITTTNDPGSIVIHSGQPAVHSNISELYASFKDDLHRHIKSWMGVPLIARAKVIGLISIDHTEVDAYSEEDVQITLAFANQVAVALENARLYEIEVRQLERELKIAHQIQATLLPQAAPQILGLDIAGRIIPARQVSGDFFHFFTTSPDHLGVAIGDVSGKGIPAALYMAAGITAIDTQIGPDILPGELMNRLNRKLYTRLHENKMNIALQIVTFTPFAQADADHDEPPFTANSTLMTIASGGMIAPIVASRRGCRLLPVGALPVGALPSPPQFYTDDVFFIDSNMVVVFTSDGIVEAKNAAGELFGFERLEETILEIMEANTAQQVVDHIINTVERYSNGVEQHDDMTVVVVTKK